MNEEVHMSHLQSIIYNFHCALAAYNQSHPDERLKGEEALLVGLKIATEFLEIRKQVI